MLIENNLLEYVAGTQTYKTTAKGLNFLKKQPKLASLQTIAGERQAALYNYPKNKKVAGLRPV